MKHDYVSEMKQGDGEVDQDHKLDPPPSWLFKRKNVEHETFLPGYDKPGSVGDLGIEDAEYGFIPPSKITRDLPPAKNWGLVYYNYRGEVEGTSWLVATENQITHSRQLEPLPCPWWWCMHERRYGNTCHTSVPTRDIFAVEGVDLWGKPEMPFRWDSVGSFTRSCIKPLRWLVGSCPYWFMTLILLVEVILAFNSDLLGVVILSSIPIFCSFMALNYHRKKKVQESYSKMPKSDAVTKYIRWYNMCRIYLQIATILLILFTITSFILSLIALSDASNERNESYIDEDNDQYSGQYNAQDSAQDYAQDDAADNAEYKYVDIVAALVTSSFVLTFVLACIMTTQQKKYRNEIQYSEMKMTGFSKSGYPFQFQLETHDAVRFHDYCKLIMIKNADSEKQVKVDEIRISQFI